MLPCHAHYKSFIEEIVDVNCLALDIGQIERPQGDRDLDEQTVARDVLTNAYSATVEVLGLMKLEHTETPEAAHRLPNPASSQRREERGERGEAYRTRSVHLLLCQEAPR